MIGYITIKNQNQIQMKNMKSLFVAVFCTTLSFGSFSQTDTKNTDCSSARWISAKRSTENAALFSSLPEIFVEMERQSDLNLLFSTREIQEVGPMTDDNGKPIVQTMDDGTQTFVYQDKTIKIVQSDIPLVDDNGDPIIETLADGGQAYVFPPPVITSLVSYDVLVDDNGDLLVRTLDDGTEIIVNPSNVDFTIQPQSPAIDPDGNLVGFPQGNPVEYSISEFAISELRIVEARSYDAATGLYSDDFHVSRIGFCMNTEPNQQERLWVDLVAFFENMENPEESPFYKILASRGYKGFQYKQNPCK